jgi:hypothetical protein
MGKYSFRGRRKAVEEFKARQGLGILVGIGGILTGLLLLHGGTLCGVANTWHFAWVYVM